MNVPIWIVAVCGIGTFAAGFCFGRAAEINYQIRRRWRDE